MTAPETLSSLPTPCLLVERGRVLANGARMRQRAKDLGATLRPHLKTAKSVEVWRATMADDARGGVVSTLDEAAYFLERGVTDLTYAVGITPHKIDEVAALNTRGASIEVITDDLGAARLLGARAIPTSIEIDCGQHRGGIDPDDTRLLPIAEALGPTLRGVLTHAGHSYGCRTVAEIEAVAEQERRAAVRAAERIRAAGLAVAKVSVGSTPTALFAAHLDGVTELRAGVYVFFDRFQRALGCCGDDDLALSVLTSVVARREDEGVLWVDAGTLALSSETSLASRGDATYGEVIAADGSPLGGSARVDQLNQAHGRIVGVDRQAFDALPVGARLRVIPNHACITAAMFDRYHVLDGDAVVETWPRLRG